MEIGSTSHGSSKMPSDSVERLLLRIIIAWLVVSQMILVQDVQERHAKKPVPEITCQFGPCPVGGTRVFDDHLYEWTGRTWVEAAR